MKPYQKRRDTTVRVVTKPYVKRTAAKSARTVANKYKDRTAPTDGQIDAETDKRTDHWGALGNTRELSNL